MKKLIAFLLKLKTCGCFSISPILFTALLFFGFSANLVGQTFDYEANLNTVNPITGCTPVCVSFTISNPEDTAITNVSLNLFFINAFEIVDPGDFTLVKEDSMFMFGVVNVTADLYALSGLTVPASSDTTIEFCLQVVTGIVNGTGQIWYSACEWANCTDLEEAPEITPSSAILIGSPGDTTLLTDINNGGSTQIEPTSTTKDVIISGVLIVDTTYTFNFSSLRFNGAESALKVANSSLLTLNGTNLSGCVEMWEGIEVYDGGNLIFRKAPGFPTSTSIIEDALNGVTVNHNSTVNITGTQFLNNRTGIYVPPRTPLNLCNITANSNIFDVVELKTPFSGGTGIAGVHVNDLKQPLVLNKNFYHNLQFGIYSTNGTINVNADKFEDIFDTGILIESTGTNSLSQTGVGSNESFPTFKNCTTGIFAHKVHVQAKNNVMHDVTWGILMEDGIYRKADVSNNIIEAKRVGIGFHHWWPTTAAGSVTVKDNTIRMNGNSMEGAAIKAEMLYAINSSACVIENNDIELEASRFGIYANNSFKLGILENSIEMLNSEVYDGIRLDDATNNNLFCNSILGSDVTDQQTGILVRTSTTNTLSCNTVDALSVGVQHLGMNSPTFIKGNSFNNHLTGMKYSDQNSPVTTITGVQNHNGNHWNDTLSGGSYGLAHWGSILDITQSKIIFDSLDGSGLKTNEPASKAATIFQNLTGSTFNGCGGGCPPVTGFTDSTSDLDFAIANGGFTATGNFGAAQTWTAKRQLFRRLLATPSLHVDLITNALDTFYTDSRRNTVGKLELVAFGMDTMFSKLQMSMVVDVINTFPDTIVVRMEDLKEIVDKLDTASYPGSIASLEAAKEALIEDIAELEDSLSTVEGYENAIREGIAETILDQNDEITVSEDYEIFQQAVNRIQLRNIISGVTELTEGQLDTLTAIANTCPYLGGEAVFQARAMLNDDAVYNDSLLCLPPSLIRRPADAAPTAAFKLYPNPSTGYTLVELKEAAEMEGQVVLFNSLGRQLYSQKIAKGDTTLVLVFDELSPGTYFLQVNTGNMTSTQRFINLK